MRGLVDRKLVDPPPQFLITGRPKAALLFWFHGDFKGGALLFLAILVIYVRQAGNHLHGKLLLTWLLLVKSIMVSFCVVLFPTGCLGRDLELN